MSAVRGQVGVEGMGTFQFGSSFFSVSNPGADPLDEVAWVFGCFLVQICVQFS